MLGTGDQEPVFISRTSASQWIDESDEPNTTEVHTELPNVLWAYKTTARTPTGEMPFRLTHGTEAVILVEVGVTSMRREAFNEDSNNNQLRVNLNYLDKVRDKASQKMAKY